MRKPGINMTVGVLLLVVAFGISAPALWGASQLVKQDEVEAVADAGGGGATGGPANVTVVAERSRFDPTTVTVSAGVEVTVTLENRDVGLLHNIAFYTNPSASTAIFVGELFPGEASVTEVFTSPATAGTYFFRCDVHPDTMTGAFIVQ